MNYSALILSTALLATSVFADTRGFSENSKARNTALLVSAANGLPGLDYDIDNVEEMTDNKASGFSVERLENGKATVARISEQLVLLTDSSDAQATHLFYFTGHGGRGTILAEDRSMKFDEIKAALLKGRQQWGPMARLTFMLDSCYSGSLIDPLRSAKPMAFLDSPQVVAQEMVDSLVEELSPKRGENPLYKSLFAFVSASSNETCLAGNKGSAFTVALKSAWDKALSENYTIEKFITETQKATKGSHPTARLVPSSLAQEILVQQ